MQRGRQVRISKSPRETKSKVTKGVSEKNEEYTDIPDREIDRFNEVKEETRGYKKIKKNTKIKRRQVPKQQEDRFQFQHEAEAETVEAIYCEELGSITQKDVERKMEIEREKTGIQDEEFEEW